MVATSGYSVGPLCYTEVVRKYSQFTIYFIWRDFIAVKRLSQFSRESYEKPVKSSFLTIQQNCNSLISLLPFVTYTQMKNMSYSILRRQRR